MTSPDRCPLPADITSAIDDLIDAAHEAAHPWDTGGPNAIDGPRHNEEIERDQRAARDALEDAIARHLDDAATDEEARECVERLGIDVTTWAAEVRAKAQGARLASPPSLAPLRARAEALLAVADKATCRTLIDNIAEANRTADLFVGVGGKVGDVTIFGALDEMNEVAAALRDAPALIRDLLAALGDSLPAATETASHLAPEAEGHPVSACQRKAEGPDEAVDIAGIDYNEDDDHFDGMAECSGDIKERDAFAYCAEYLRAKRRRAEAAATGEAEKGGAGLVADLDAVSRALKISACPASEWFDAWQRIWNRAAPSVDPDDTDLAALAGKDGAA